MSGYYADWDGKLRRVEPVTCDSLDHGTCSECGDTYCDRCPATPPSGCDHDRDLCEACWPGPCLPCLDDLSENPDLIYDQQREARHD